MTITPDRKAQSDLLFRRVKNLGLDGISESELGDLERDGFRIHMDRAERIIDEYSDGLINRLCEATTDTTLPAAIKLLAGICYASDNPELYRFQRDSLSTGKSSPIYIHQALGGLPSYQRPSAAETHTHHDPLTTDQIEALTAATAILQDAKYRSSPEGDLGNWGSESYKWWIPVTLMLGSTVIVGNALTGLIIENPGKAEHIADTILRLHTADTERIRSVITVEAPSLSSGTL